VSVFEGQTAGEENRPSTALRQSLRSQRSQRSSITDHQGRAVQSNEFLFLALARTRISGGANCSRIGVHERRSLASFPAEERASTRSWTSRYADWNSRLVNQRFYEKVIKVAYTAEEIDFIVAYIVPENLWYVIPITLAASPGQMYVSTNGTRYFRREKHREAWCQMACPHDEISPTRLLVKR
jgi:hypothetical protein